MTRKFFYLITLTCLFAFQTTQAQQIDKSITIVGGGLVGLLEAYHSLIEAEAKGETVQVTVLEKNGDISETTICNIFPSLTPDEIMSVVPRGSDLVKFLQQKFNEGQGVRVDDVPGIDNTSEAVSRFIRSVELYGEDDEGHQERTKALLDLGKYSMDLWQNFYETADDELKEILIASNYKPCLEVDSEHKALHCGYRIDIIFNDKEAASKASGMQASYNSLGYLSSRILTPSEVISIDPQLEDFVLENTVSDEDGSLKWVEDAIAIWRPGGCINAGFFIPKFVEYLERKSPTFAIKFDHQVVGVDYENSTTIANVKVRHSDEEASLVPNADVEVQKEFIFAPGEAVGTLRTLGFNEPDYAIFAGPSLRLSIDIPEGERERYKNLNHCMEVHQEGIVLAWQAKYMDGKVLIGVAGTKAFYGDKRPNINEEFARERHLLQINIVNNVYGDLISTALGKKVDGILGQSELDSLINKGIAKVWVGSRAVAYDGFPTLGYLYKNNEKIQNARVTTHLGSGGGSFSFGSIALSRSIVGDVDEASPLAKKVNIFSDSRR